MLKLEQCAMLLLVSTLPAATRCVRSDAASDASNNSSANANGSIGDPASGAMTCSEGDEPLPSPVTIDTQAPGVEGESMPEVGNALDVSLYVRRSTVGVMATDDFVLRDARRR